METNYIVHLNHSFKRFTDDEKATPFHISLYMALFHKWNSAKFRNPISVARDDLMFLSKIGSANTYIKCLKELHSWGYIKYVPSHSYHIGSKIYMYNFSTTKNTTSNKTITNAPDISINKANRKTSAQDLRPYKNSKKYIKNNINIENGQAQQNNSEIFQSEKGDSNSDLSSKKTKQSGKNSEATFEKPTIESLTEYFLEKQQQPTEAEKFYNYFESNGWLIGGKTPMKNWKAASNNWILNSKKFAHNSKNNGMESKHPAGKLHTETNKNYNEPL